MLIMSALGEAEAGELNIGAQRRQLCNLAKPNLKVKTKEFGDIAQFKGPELNPQYRGRGK